MARGKLKNILCAAIFILFITRGFASYADDVYHDSKDVDTWFQSIAEITKAPIGALHLYKFFDGYYVLTQPIGWFPEKQEDLDLSRVDVPAFFVTDLTSIPSIFFILLRPDGPYTHAAIAHDYLYWTQGVDRKEADDIFYAHMVELGVNLPTAKAIYWGVRVAGSGAWKSNAKKRTNGERRILKFIPDSPAVKWQDWKSDDSNF